MRCLDLKCGIEVHQRLATKQKLFCACPGRVSEKEKASGEVRRFLRPVYGEMGEVDPAAEFEGSRRRSFTYQILPEHSCLVELDEAPPREINEEALEAVIEISLMLGCRVLDEIYAMRKTVVDGSAISGFQRTALAAVDGKIECSFGTVKIATVCVEEESAGIVERKGSEVVYRLDRLGIPLIEIATGAGLKSGKEAREAAEKIGLLLRSAGRAQRGIGSIRQDLNVSVEGGARVEIKGAQELGEIPELVDNEGKRQAKLLEVKEALGKRPVEKEKQSKIVDVTSELNKTNCSFVKKGIAEGKGAFALRLKGLKGLLGVELLPGHRLGTELSDYAKASAGIAGITHSDEELHKYAFSENEIRAISNKLECGELDGWALCVAERNAAEKALDAAAKRAAVAREGVPKETRKADGVRSRFMRPLPGSARMYPETDAPPVAVSKELVKKISGKLPEGFEAKVERMKAMGLSAGLAKEMARSEKAGKFEELLLKTRAEPTLVAVTLLQTLTSLSRQGAEVEKISESELEKTLSAVAEGEIVKSAVPVALQEIAAGEGFEQAVRKRGLERISGEKLLQLANSTAEKEGFGADGGKVGEKRVYVKIIAQHRLQVDPEELYAAVAALGAKHFKHEGVNK